MKVTKEGAGAYYSWHAKIAGLPVRGFDVYTEFVPNQPITDRSSIPLAGTWDYDFEPEGSRTKLTMEHHPGLLWRIPPLRSLMDLSTGRVKDFYLARVRTLSRPRAPEGSVPR